MRPTNTLTVRLKTFGFLLACLLFCRAAPPPESVRLEGALPRAEILKVVKKGKRSIRRCYKQALRRDSTLAGRVEVIWRIKTTGKVGFVVIDNSQIDDEKLLDCMVTRIERWRFPQPAGGGVVNVQYPFVLKTAD